jgi:signal transduction histidine kinase
MSYDPQVRDLVGGMTEAIQRMQSVIHEIITVSRIMTNKIDLSVSPVNVRNQIEKSLTTFKDALQQRQISVKWTPEDFPTNLRGDTELILMLLNNLISNAIKYTPDGGSVTLKGRNDGNQLSFSVRDTGIGIDRADQKKIFERFHTSSDIDLHSTSKTAFGGGGLGLGLSICKGIVEAHGGRIWVESEKRDPQTLPGSEFFVVLPMNYQRKTGKLTPTT